MRTYYQRRNFSNSSIFGNDPCPVCMEYHNRPNTNFCSTKCTALANNFRKRVVNFFVKLSILDFYIEFTHGVFPKVHLPGYATRFYPQGENSFFLGNPGSLDIRHAVLGDFWSTVRFEIGDHATQFIVEQKMSDNRGVHEYRKLFEQWLTLGLQTDETHFICNTCNNIYLKSFLTNWHADGDCTSCSTAKIPF